MDGKMDITFDLLESDADKICRTCFQQSTRLHPLFTKTDKFPKMSLADILLYVAKIDIKNTITQIMPSHMCGNCSRKLKNAYTFVLKAQETHECLRKFVKRTVVRQPDCLLEAPIDIPIQNPSEFLQIKVETEEMCVPFTPNPENNDIASELIDVNSDTAEFKKHTKVLNLDSDCEDEELTLPTNKGKARLSETNTSRTSLPSASIANKTDDFKQEPDTNVVPCAKPVDDPSKENNLLDPITVPMGMEFYNTLYNDLYDDGAPGGNDESFGDSSDSNCGSSIKKTKKKSWHDKQKENPHRRRSTRMTKGTLTSDKRTVCDICGETFAWKKDLIRHQRFHEPVGNEYECTYCSKMFLRKDKLKNHIKMHLRNINENTKVRKRTHPEWNFADKLFAKEPFKCIECKLCSKTFTTTQELREHIRQHSDRVSIYVDNNEVIKDLYPSSQMDDIINLICDDIQDNRWAKFYSIINIHGYEMCLSDSDADGDPPLRTYTCEMCSEVFNRKFKVFAHIKEKHASEKLPHKCPVCRVEFVCKEMFDIHLRTQCKNKAKKFKCMRCPGKFMWVENLDNHQCSYRYAPNNEGLDAKIRIPKKRNKEILQCDVCEKTFYWPQHLKRHKESHIPDGKTHECHLCFQKFLRSDNLRTHMRTHTKRRKKIECRLCETKFQKLSQLRQHIFTHSDGLTGVNLQSGIFVEAFYPNGATPSEQISQMILADFAAQNIAKFYSAVDDSGNELNLSDSETDAESATAIEQLAYKCELCNKEFNRRKRILLHQHSEHANEQLPHACTLCEKKFVCIELLQRHLKTNCCNANRKWQCPKCSAKFVWQVNLHNHLNIKHYDPENIISNKMARKLQCDECEKTFVWPKDLNRHKRCHLPEDEKFECPLCDRRFNRKDNMQAHMKVHGNPNTPTGSKLCAKNKLKVCELEEHLCKPNGCKIIQCKICLSKHMKIGDLRAHLKEHKDNTSFENRQEEVMDISLLLYPEETPMRMNDLVERISKDICDNRLDKFYSITNEFGFEMDLNYSETESDSEGEEEIIRNSYACDLCAKTFDRRYKLFEHQNYSHKWLEAPHSCQVCEARFVSVEMLNLHLRTQCENLRKRFACKRCPWKFMWKDNLKNHVRTVHAEQEDGKIKPETQRKYTCKVCEKTFMWQKDLTRHMGIHVPGGGLFKCSWCPRKFHRRENLHVHLKRHGVTPEGLAAVESYISSTSGPNGPKLVTCKRCNKQFTNISNLRDHIQQYPFGSCQDPTVDSEGVLQLKQEVIPYKSIANYSITSTLGYELDIDDSETDNDTDPSKYVCEICNSEFGRKHEIAQHQRSLHKYDEMPKKCTNCNFKTVSESILAYHMKTQCCNEEKQFKCEICSFKFMWKENLENHRRIIHEADEHGTAWAASSSSKAAGVCQTFECLTCNRKYSRKDRLMTHIKKHEKKSSDASGNGTGDDAATGEKQKKILPKKFLCAHCGRAVTSSSNLIIHMRRHTGEKPFKCEFCNKGFPRSSDLACHRRTHTGEKPHKCTVCDKAFSRSYKLQTHMRIHSGERPYKCTYCEKSFAQSNDLTLHVRRHTGERPYVCGICGERFIQGTALKNHRQMRGHFEQIEPNVSTLLLL